MPMMSGLEQRVIDGVRFYNSLLKIPEDRPVTKLFDMIKNVNKENWYSDMEYHLTRLGLCDEWTNGGNIDIGLVRNKLNAVHECEWLEEVTKKAKLRTYALFRTKRGVEHHITSQISKSQWSLIFGLRSGTVPLEIELDRFKEIPGERRICQSCNSDRVEDEYHFLFECDAHNAIRKLFLNRIQLNPNRLHLADDFRAVFRWNYEFGKNLKRLMKDRKVCLKVHSHECQRLQVRCICVKMIPLCL